MALMSGMRKNIQQLYYDYVCDLCTHRVTEELCPSQRVWTRLQFGIDTHHALTSWRPGSRPWRWSGEEKLTKISHH